MRDTACAPQPPTNQPTGHQISRQGLYVPKKAYSGAKMAVFGPNILIILGGSKSSGTYISENHLGTSLALFFGRAWHQMDQKGHILGQISNCLAREQTFWYSHIRKPTRHLVPIVFFFRQSNKMDQKCKYLAPNDQKCQFFAKFGRFWAKNPNS